MKSFAYKAADGYLQRFDQVFGIVVWPASLVAEVTKHRGRLAFIAQSGQLPINPTVNKGLRVYGCWHWNLNYVQRMMATIAGSPEQIDTIITHRLPMSKVGEARGLRGQSVQLIDGEKIMTKLDVLLVET